VSPLTFDVSVKLSESLLDSYISFDAFEGVSFTPAPISEQDDDSSSSILSVGRLVTFPFVDAPPMHHCSLVLMCLCIESYDV